MTSNAYEYLHRHPDGPFSLAEWSYAPTRLEPGILMHVEETVLVALYRLRGLHGSAIYPSKLPSGWARFSGSKTSRHYAGGSQLSIACDVFPAEDVLGCWLKAVSMPEWGGFGVYLDTNRTRLQPGPMLHLDLRESDRVFWVREKVGKKREYVYLHDEPIRFWKLMAKAAEI